MRRVAVIGVLVSFVLGVFGVFPAAADTVNYGGMLDAADPTMPVVFIVPPNCTSQGVTPVNYEVQVFEVSLPGVYTVDLTSTAGAASIYLYAVSFDPNSGMTNCVAADNSPMGGDKQIVFGLTAGTLYYLVVFNDFATSFLPYTYSVTITGPGTIWLGGRPVEEAEEGEEPAVQVAVPGCDVRIIIPSTAVGATITTDTLAYWKPGEATSTLLTAGTNVRAIAQADGYYQILFACNFLYVPVSTIGPNYESPWNGTPLP